jgi:hypothetical protein
MHANSKPHSRPGCSTIGFGHLALDEALALIGELGFPRSIWAPCPGTRFPT